MYQSQVTLGSASQTMFTFKWSKEIQSVLKLFFSKLFRALSTIIYFLLITCISFLADTYNSSGMTASVFIMVMNSAKPFHIRDTWVQCFPILWSLII